MEMIGVIYKETILFKVYLHIKLIYSFNIILENTYTIKPRIKRSNIPPFKLKVYIYKYQVYL